MANIWLEHFGKKDYAHLALKYNQVADSGRVSFITGRGGRPGISIVWNWAGNNLNGLYKALGANKTELYAGVAFNRPTPSMGYSDYWPILSFWDDIYTQFGVWVSNQGLLRIRRYNWAGNVGGGAFLTDPGPPITFGTWHYIELYGNWTNNTFKCWLDGRLVFDGAGLIQQYQDWGNVILGGAYANAVVLAERVWLSGTPPDSIKYSDFYINDTTGGEYNTRMGDLRVGPRMPIGPGSSAQWAPTGAAANWDCVEEAPPDPAQYVGSATPGDLDLYEFEPITFTGTVKSCMVTTFATKADGGQCDIKHACKSGAVTAKGAAIPVTETAGCQTTVFEVDPNTAAAWTVAGLDAAEFGAEKQ